MNQVAKEEINSSKIFTPPFCPNPDCRAHNPKKHKANNIQKNWYVRRGIKNFIQQYICKHCSRSFSVSTFHISYYEKVSLSYKKILKTCRENITLENWSLKMETTAPTLKIRLHKLLWLLTDQLEKRIKSGQFQGDLSKAADLLADCQTLYARHKSRTYRILRDLILRFKELLIRRVAKVGRRLLKSKLEEQILQIVRTIIGQWSYPMSKDFRWFPCHPQE